MGKRVCAEPGCPELQAETRCPIHRRERERARGTSSQRGYDYAHQQERAHHQSRMDAGVRYDCRRCLQPIEPGSPWDLGHPDADCPRPKGPEHAGCNRAVAGR